VAGVLTGSARLSKEADDRVAAQHHGEEVARRRREIADRRAAAERQIAELRAEIAAQETEGARLMAQDQQRETVHQADLAAMGASRGVHGNGKDANGTAGHDPQRGMR